MSAAQAQIRASITRVGSEYRKDVTSGTCELCITDWAARSSPSASSRPSKPAPAPRRWSGASMARTSTTATGTRSSSSLNPGASRVTLTKDGQPLVDAWNIREGWSFLRERRDEQSENTSKNDRRNAHATSHHLLR